MATIECMPFSEPVLEGHTNVIGIHVQSVDFFSFYKRDVTLNQEMTEQDDSSIRSHDFNSSLQTVVWNPEKEKTTCYA